ncbi:MAG TPA: recombinase family protein, partial [Hyphomonadaceae bacterium]|nr:recombinase family protein [Hyphomonadaceae bacterium]
MKADMEGVTYARVSSSKQMRESDSLASQQRRCEDFARSRGVVIVQHFVDDVSGSSAQRPGMKAMLEYLAGRPEKTAVVIDDISRLARGIKTHQTLREAIASVGGVMMSPNIEFGDDPDSEMIEFIQATIAQHARRKNAQQTRNRMRSRVLNGWWPFYAPIGYKHERSPGGGKVLVRDEPAASFVAEVFEGFACGRFETVAEATRFLQSSPGFPKDPNGRVLENKIHLMLRRRVYTGYVYSEEFGIEPRKGHHEALVSLQTWQQVQDRLEGKNKAPLRKNHAVEFPLRQFVLCACGRPLTAAWSKGRTKSYAYYECPSKDCPDRRKAISREKLEQEFEDLLAGVEPRDELFLLVRAMLKEIWENQRASSVAHADSLKALVRKLDKQIETTLDRIVDASTTSVQAAREKRVAKLELEKQLAAEQMANLGRPKGSLEEISRTALDFLANPLKLWRYGGFSGKRLAMKLVFSERLTYVRNQGYRTPNLSLPFKAMRDFFDPNLGMARPKRFELLTPRFVVWCS